MLSMIKNMLKTLLKVLKDSKCDYSEVLKEELLFSKIVETSLYKVLKYRQKEVDRFFTRLLTEISNRYLSYYITKYLENWKTSMTVEPVFNYLELGYEFKTDLRTLLSVIDSGLSVDDVACLITRTVEVLTYKNINNQEVLINVFKQNSELRYAVYTYLLKKLYLKGNIRAAVKET